MYVHNLNYSEQSNINDASDHSYSSQPKLWNGIIAHYYYHQTTDYSLELLTPEQLLIEAQVA